MATAVEKLVLLGEPAVGKTSIARRLCDRDYFSEVYAPTNGLEFFTKKHETQPNTPAASPVILQVWEAGAAEVMHSQCTSTAMLRNTTCVMLVYDTTSKETLANCWRWYDFFAKSPDIAVMLVGTKVDLVEKREVQHHEALEKAKEFGAAYGECSTKLSNESVTKLLNSLLAEAQDRRVHLGPPVNAPQPPKKETACSAPKLNPLLPSKRESVAVEDSNHDSGTPSRFTYPRFQATNFSMRNSMPVPAPITSMPLAYGTQRADPLSMSMSGKFEPTERHPSVARETHQQSSAGQRTPQGPQPKVPAPLMPQAQNSHYAQYSQYPQFSEHPTLSRQNPRDNLGVSIDGLRHQSVNSRITSADLEPNYYSRQNSRLKIEQLKAPQTMQELQQLRQTQPCSTPSLSTQQYSGQLYTAPRIGLRTPGQSFFRQPNLSPMPSRVMPEPLYPTSSTAPSQFSFGWKKD